MPQIAVGVLGWVVCSLEEPDPVEAVPAHGTGVRMR